MKNDIKTGSKLLTLLSILGLWTIIALIFAGLAYAVAVSDGKSESAINAFYINIIRYYIWAALSPLISLFVWRFPIKIRPVNIGHLLLHILALLIFCSTHIGIFFTIEWNYSGIISNLYATLPDYIKGAYLSALTVNILIYLLIVLSAQALLLYQSYRAAELRQQTLKSELAQAQLQALKMQLQPHFLFNTLHSISILILSDPVKANSMIARLEDFLRLTLEHAESQIVQLKEEIDFLRCYLEIEQVRFHDRLTISFDLQTNIMTTYVPHMLLQPIVENAIKYAVAPATESISITIMAKHIEDKLYLTVQDTGIGMSDIDNWQAHVGRGLRNVQARLTQLYGNRATLSLKNNRANGLMVTIELPFEID